MSLRAAMFLPGLRPGSMGWKIYQDFAAGMRRQGLDFEVWTDRPAAPVAVVPGTRFLPLRPAPLGLDRLLSPLTRTTRLLETARTLAPHLAGAAAPDVIYVELAYPFGVGVDLGRRLARSRVPLVVTPMGEDVLSIPDASYGFCRYPVPRWLLRRTLARATAVRCISPLVIEHVRPYTSAPHPIIPLGVSEETVEAASRDPQQLRRDRASRRRALADRYGLDDAPVVVSLGRLHPFKGIDLLIEAMRDVPDARLLIVGPSLTVKGRGDTLEQLRGVAQRAGVTERVLFTGAIPHEQVLDVLGAADVVVVPSLLESMNKVTIEAVAAGAPIVVTRTTGISRFFDEPGIGQVIEPRSVRAIAAAVNAVVRGEWAADRAAGQRFVARFAPDTVGAELADLLRMAAKR